MPASTAVSRVRARGSRFGAVAVFLDAPFAMPSSLPPWGYASRILMRAEAHAQAVWFLFLYVLDVRGQVAERGHQVARAVITEAHLQRSLRETAHLHVMDAGEALQGRLELTEIREAHERGGDENVRALRARGARNGRARLACRG